MKIKYLFIITFLLFVSILPTQAMTAQTVFDTVFTENISSSNELQPYINIITSIDSNLWVNKKYMVVYKNTSTIAYEFLFYSGDSYLTVYSINGSTNSITITQTTVNTYLLNYDANIIQSYNYTSGTFDFYFKTNATGKIMFTNIDIKYLNPDNTYSYIINREIPWYYFPEGHPLRIVNNDDVLSGDQIDSIIDTNLTTILDEFDIDLLFENLESVLQQIYGFIESAFLSLNEVITYITSSLNNVVSFITANITIISIISMVYLALPSILRDLFTLALSTSVVFIMLRRFI